MAEGIRHFQPMPDVSASGYKKFVQLMGAPPDRLFLFPPNTHDQIAITALAMERAKSPMAVDWSKQIITVGNGPGQEVDDVVEALKLVREGKAGQLPGCGVDVRFHPQRRPARPRHGPVDHQGRQERVRRIREAVAAERAAGPEDEPQADADANFSAAARYGALSSTRSPPR